MQDKERQRDDGGNAHHSFTRIYEPVTARRTKVVVQGLDGYIIAEKHGQLLVSELKEEQRIKEFGR